ncbi:MAG TPA: mechanosensitive ion channel [Candidatus Lachnoclostridium stercoripullorum]|uniref:Mechanosensitive ion channel n=1 Tax=Candidatus Lachnoclostridium stercoripullorum TaxID=2838635 RepID=A0A9D1W5J5_9FIRM|nr:mechanosensitive ion channel [Candidatus Lachnoclostridium stercoripullorum]
MSETLKSWLSGLSGFGMDLLVAAVILGIGFKITGAVRRMAERSFARMEMELSLRKFLLSLIQALMYGLLIFMAAERIGIQSSSIIALLGSAGVTLGLALQGSLSNFAGGVLILLVRPFKVGDYIVSEYGEGTVAAIGLVYTTLNTVDNKTVVIPNGSLSNSPITNATAEDFRRLDLTVGIGYQSDLRKAKEILLDIYTSHPCILKDRPIQVFVDQLAASSVVIGGRGWTATGDYWQTRWDITEKIKLRFDEAGIQIPFNQLDVHVNYEGKGDTEG